MIGIEEVMKNVFVMLFILMIFGYDVFDLLEVVFEFMVDVGIKKGEKIDYVIMCDSEV